MAGKQGGPRGIANRLLAIRFIENQTSLCQPIDIGSLHQRVPIACEVVSQVVSCNKQYVKSMRVVCVRCGCGYKQSKGQYCKEVSHWDRPCGVCGVVGGVLNRDAALVLVL